MKITYTTKFLQQINPAFVLKEKEKLSKHHFFKSLSKEDQNLLILFEKHKHLKGSYAHIVFLSSGQQVLVIGVGERWSHRKAILTMRRIVATARTERIGKVVVNFDDFKADKKNNAETLAEVMAMQFEMANFDFVKYKTPPKEKWFFVDEIYVVGREKKNMQAALRRGQIIGEEINKARILSNTPGGDMTPQVLAQAARKAGHIPGLKVKILDEQAMRRLKMGGILGVSKGSVQKPRFIVMEYLKGKKNDKPVVLVGKGVTFDTGGLNLKPDKGMYEMHMDMSGGAAAIHVIAALARLKIKRNIIALIPAVENMTSGSSYRPGDLLKSMSGKTIEVLNTDAEGRVILADGLTYAQRYKPRLVIDIATLTGAAQVALGQRATALFATDVEIEQKLRESGEITGDFVWPLPLWEEYEEEVKGTFGDVANIGKTGYGGAITAAMVHLDIAPRMTTIEGEYLAKGAAGASVALLVNFLRMG